MDKVYILTKAKPMGESVYAGVFATKRAAERFIFRSFPNAKREEKLWDSLDSFVCKHPGYGDTIIMRIQEEEVQGE